MISAIFGHVNYTHIEDVITTRTTNITILGLAIYTWNAHNISILVSKWGKITDHTNLNPTSDSYTSSTIQIETTFAKHIDESLNVMVEGKLYTVNILEVQSMTPSFQPCININYTSNTSEGGDTSNIVN